MTTPGTAGEAEIARQLANWMLQKPDQRGWGGQPPDSYLAERVKAKVRDLTDEIAAEVVAAHPHLEGFLRQEISTLVANMLADERNGVIQQALVTAVAKAFREETSKRDSDDDE